MTGRPQDGGTPRTGREKRLSAALRANLSRRKRQQRERSGDGLARHDADIVAGADKGGRTDLRVAENNNEESS